MPSDPTLSSMPLTSLDLAAPVPVMSRICSCTLFSDSWPTAATATNSTSRQPKPSPKRVEMERDLKREGGMVSLGALG